MTGARAWSVGLGLLWLALLGGATFALFGALTGGDARHLYSREQAHAGILTYAQQCAACHGPDLAGSSAAPALIGEDFWARWGDRPVSDLYAYIHEKMPLGRGGSLSSEAYVEATAYVLWGNRLPAGENPLTPARDEPIAREDQMERPERIAPVVRPAEALLGPWIDSLRATAQSDGGESESGADDGEPQSADGTAGEGAGEASGDGDGGDPSSGNNGDGGDGGDGGDADEGSGGSDGGGEENGDSSRITPSEQEYEGPDPRSLVTQTGDLRLSVFPSEARVTITPEGDGASVRESVGGTRVIAGLPAGEVEVEAVHQGRTLRQTVTVRAGDALEVEMRFPGGAEDTPAAEADLDDEDAVAGVTLDADRLYAQQCAHCHGREGAGGPAPALAGNPRLEDAEWTARRVLLGGLGMPSFHRTLTDRQIAEVVSHVRTHFGNDYGAVEPSLVSDVRERLARTLPGPEGAELEHAPLGRQRYVQLCAACHGLHGGGDIGPPLAVNPALQDDGLVITRILFGGGQMPAFAHHPDETIAAVASYIRTAWSNDYPPITPGQVEAFRPDSNSEGDPDARSARQDADESR